MTDNTKGTEPQPPVTFPQAPPPPDQLLQAMNTSNMIFEMQGTLGEVKQAVLALHNLVAQNGTRLEAVERSNGEIKTVLGQLAPKIDDVAGFIKHRGPSLVDEAKLNVVKNQLSTEIANRPTRRQAIVDIAWVVGLISAAVALGSRFAK